MALARERLGREGVCRVALERSGTPSWRDALRGSFDAVVSGSPSIICRMRAKQLSIRVYALLEAWTVSNNDAVTSPPALQEWLTILWYREMQAQERLRAKALN